MANNTSALDSCLQQRYEVAGFRNFNSTQISSRTSSVVAKLTAELEDGSKPVIVRLTAQARVANKLVTIVEIAKRELASRSTKCFQYTALSSEMVDIPRQKPAKNAAQAPQDEDPDDEDGFETMGTGDETKKRNVPIMTVYLSTSSIKELRAQYGEQR